MRQQIRFVGHHPHPTIRQLTKTEVVGMLTRGAKRQLIAEGQIQDPRTRPKRYLYIFDCAGVIGQVKADTTGEARAKIKKQLGISKNKRLPKDIQITRKLNDNTG